MEEQFNGDLVPHEISEPQMDEIVDLVLTKALFDEDDTVHGLAQTLLDDPFVKPNRVRMRSLQRACARAVATKRITYTESMQLQAPWNVAVNGGTLAKRPEVRSEPNETNDDLELPRDPFE